MSKQSDLNGYIARVRRILQLRATVRGAAILFGTALLGTVIAVVLLNRYAFPHGGVVQARASLIALLLLVLVVAIALPVLWLTRGPRRAQGRGRAS